MRAGVAYQPLAAGALGERWRRLLVEPGAPEFCERDEYGDVIEMHPPRRPHQRLVWSIQQQIADSLGSEALPGVGVLTRIGVRVPDPFGAEGERDAGAFGLALTLPADTYPR